MQGIARKESAKKTLNALAIAIVCRSAIGNVQSVGLSGGSLPAAVLPRDCIDDGNHCKAAT